MLATSEECREINRDMMQDRETAEWFLLHYEEEMETYRRAKEESRAGGGMRGGEGKRGRGGGPGKPTETKAIKNAVFDENYKPYLWLKSVEILQSGLGERKKMFLCARREAESTGRYRKGKRAWVVYVQQRYMEMLQRRYANETGYVSESTVKKWWYGMVQKAAEIHCRLKNF